MVEESDVSKPKVSILLGEKDENEYFIAIADNGPGFPEEDTSKLTEPYVTHKHKGTGLGLAIVKKIMEDHNGSIVLGSPDWLATHTEWTDLKGACVVLTLPRIDI